MVLNVGKIIEKTFIILNAQKREKETKTRQRKHVDR